MIHLAQYVVVDAIARERKVDSFSFTFSPLFYLSNCQPNSIGIDAKQNRIRIIGLKSPLILRQKKTPLILTEKISSHIGPSAEGKNPLKYYSLIN